MWRTRQQNKRLNQAKKYAIDAKVNRLFKAFQELVQKHGYDEGVRLFQEQVINESED